MLKRRQSKPDAPFKRQCKRQKPEGLVIIIVLICLNLQMADSKLDQVGDQPNDSDSQSIQMKPLVTEKKINIVINL